MTIKSMKKNVQVEPLFCLILLIESHFFKMARSPKYLLLDLVVWLRWLKGHTHLHWNLEWSVCSIVQSSSWVCHETHTCWKKLIFIEVQILCLRLPRTAVFSCGKPSDKCICTSDNLSSMYWHFCWFWITPHSFICLEKVDRPFLSKARLNCNRAWWFPYADLNILITFQGLLS